LSTRDIEDAFTDEMGRRLLSRATVSEITERLWAEYEDFCKRDLSEHSIVYLFVDGIAERLRPGQRREAVLATWGIGEDGRKSLLGLMAGSREDVETVRAFFQGLRARGLGDPLLLVSDGGAGDHRGDRGMLSAIGAPALPGAPDAQSRSQGPDRSIAEFKARVTAAIRRLRGRLRANWRLASAPTTPISCRARQTSITPLARSSQSRVSSRSMP
jgi:putative transposase